MLRRTGFKSKLPPRPPMLEPRPISGGIAAQVGDVVAGRPKENPLRSEPYRRLVAMLPCIYCGVEGFSQAAHPPPTGKGIKEDDRECFPLCCTRVGINGCHTEFDQGRILPREAMRTYAGLWGLMTRETIINDGKWPDNLPRLEK